MFIMKGRATENRSEGPRHAPRSMFPGRGEPRGLWRRSGFFRDALLNVAWSSRELGLSQVAASWFPCYFPWKPPLNMMSLRLCFAAPCYLWTREIQPCSLLCLDLKPSRSDWEDRWRRGGWAVEWQWVSDSVMLNLWRNIAGTAKLLQVVPGLFC